MNPSMNQSQLAALESCARRSLTVAERAEAEPLLSIRNDVALAGLNHFSVLDALVQPGHRLHALTQGDWPIDALQAVDECDAPMISIPGGEPLIHKELPQIVQGIIARKKFVYLCTNAILLPKHIDEYQPSPYFTWSIHLDGLQHRHDESVCMDGVFEKAVSAIKQAHRLLFREHLSLSNALARIESDLPPEQISAKVLVGSVHGEVLAEADASAVAFDYLQGRLDELTSGKPPRETSRLSR